VNASAADPHTLLVMHGGHWLRWMRRAGYTLSLLSLVAIGIDLGSYELGTAHGVERHSVFESSITPWNSLTKVLVGCRDRGESQTGAYDLVFAARPTVHAFPGHMTRESLEKLARLDAMLRRRDIPVERAVHTRGDSAGKPVWSPGCVEQLAKRSIVEPARLRAVLSPSHPLGDRI
jgi:hypothetical protein